jgi:ribosomal protein S18 acetylase RimI-like enzyme
MELRSLTSEDIDGVRTVARASLTVSYSGLFDEATIEPAIERWYSDEHLADAIDDDRTVFVVAEEDGEVVGFVQAAAVPEDDEGRIEWVHVHPDERGRGLGSMLFERARGRFEGRGLERVTGQVLAEYDPGVGFYESRGFQRHVEREVTIGDQTLTETVYIEGSVEARDLEPHETADGTTIYVDREDDARGSTGPFYVAYSDADRERRYGWYCGACGSAATGMDTMGRVVCSECENRRKPSRWDASYL